MITPGSNLLAQAMTLLTSQTVGLMRFNGRETQPNGDVIPTFCKAVPRKGSFQAVPKDYAVRMGLDQNKEYGLWYDPKGEARALDKGRGSDRLAYGGFIWEAVSDTNWVPPDGWRGLLFVNLKEPSCK